MKWEEKQMEGQFMRNLLDMADKDKTWSYLRSSNLKVDTEDLICVVH